MYMNGWMRKYVSDSIDILIRLDNKTIYPEWPKKFFLLGVYMIL